MQGIEEFHAEILGKNYKYNRPGLDDTPWKTKCCEVGDPFGNRLRSTNEQQSSGQSSYAQVEPGQHFPAPQRCHTQDSAVEFLGHPSSF